jgi:hypothetical protein
LLTGNQEKEILEHKEQDMKLKITALAASLSVFALGVGAQAQPAPADDAPEGFFVKKVKMAGGKDITLKLGGYVDAYYAYHTATDGDFRSPNHPAGTTTSGSGSIGAGAETNGRIFESPGQQFSLGLIQTKFEMGNDDWQVVADLIHGPNAELTNFSNLRGGATSTTSTAVKQAYVSGKLFKGLKLTAGQFGTHIGYEVVESYANANYMLGYLFGYGPFYHTGAKLDYEISDKIAVMAGVVNGWDLQADNNKDKTIIAQVTLKPISPLTVILNYAGGNETDGFPGSTTGNVGGMRHIGDVVITFEVNKMIKVGANFVYGENKLNAQTAAQRWGGAAGYVSVTPINMLTLSYRLDYFDDSMGARGLLQNTAAGITSNKVMGHTLTGTISMYDGHFLIRPEVKYDMANAGVFGSAGKKDNITALLAFTGVY